MNPLKHMIVLFFVGASIICAQTVPDYINYQGKLMNGTNLYSGAVPISFRLYDAPTGGIFPYCEDSNDVVIVDGLYSTYIGDNVIWGSLDNALIQTQVWIEVEIDGQIIVPREQLTSVGYARYAAKLPANAVTLDMIREDAVQYYHIADNQVRGNHLQAGAVSNAQLAASAVTSNKIDWSTMPTSDIPSNTYWTTAGNAGTTPGTHFIGTTDDQPLEIRANNQRVMRLDNSFTMPNITIGESNNTINPSAGSATISGGGGLNGSAPNRVTDNYGTVGGGAGNRAGNDAGSVFDAEYATVAGGAGNHASAPNTFVGGGNQNRIAAQATNAVIAGGRYNEIGLTGFDSVIGGGYSNLIESGAGGSVIGGGQVNMIAEGAFLCSVVGGQYHDIGSNSSYSAIGGGRHNTIGSQSAYSGIGAGRYNEIEDNTESATIGGGAFNRIETTATNAVIAGGQNNIASDIAVVIGGGYDNTASDRAGTVGGGYDNTASGYAGTVGGGRENTASGTDATVGGGSSHIASGNYSTVGGGNDNTASSYYTTVAGGFRNIAGGSYATIPGGVFNYATNYAFASGFRAKANHAGSFVLTDSQNADFSSTASNRFHARFQEGYQLDGGPITGDGGGLTNVNAQSVQGVVWSKDRMYSIENNLYYAYSGIWTQRLVASRSQDIPISGYHTATGCIVRAEELINWTNSAAPAEYKVVLEGHGAVKTGFVLLRVD